MTEEENYWIQVFSTPGIMIMATGAVTFFTGAMTLLIKMFFDRKREKRIIKSEIYAEVSRSIHNHKEALRQILRLREYGFSQMLQMEDQV